MPTHQLVGWLVGWLVS